jgi:hypothetical protein
MKFTVSVDARVVNNYMIESSNEFGLLNDLIAKNKDLRDKLEALNDTASISAEEAKKSANASAESASKSAKSEENATKMAQLAESYTKGTNNSVREGDSVDNAKYYYQRTKEHALAVGGLLPMGTKTFSELSLPENQEPNYMFNISENFRTDDTFTVGEGIKYSAGTNVYRTTDGFWDVFCGIESFGTGEIVTESIEDEPLDQDEGEYWIFNY